MTKNVNISSKHIVYGQINTTILWSFKGDFQKFCKLHKNCILLGNNTRKYKYLWPNGWPKQFEQIFNANTNEMTQQLKFMGIY